ncbi:hypothetical protein [Microbacterium album]|uniref:hypothetical protein n=1 Tax=Microbacterium album TaxID=2053191 RepID=UPI00166499F6|nr:hypothetical protein [Microbacterium album]
MEKWAHSKSAISRPSEIERRVLLESPRARAETAAEKLSGNAWAIALPILLFVSPVMGLAALLSSPDVTGWWNGLGLTTALIACGACFAVSVVTLGIVLSGWFHSGRKRDGASVATSLLVAVCAAISLWLIVAVAPTSPDLAGWSIPVWVAAVGGAAVAIVLLVASTRTADPKPEGRAAASLPVDVDELSEHEVQELLALRGRVVDIFAAKGEIPARVLELIPGVPLGRLHTLDDVYLKEKYPHLS